MMNRKNKDFIKKFSDDYNKISQELLSKKLIRDYKNDSIREYGNKVEITRTNKNNESRILYDNHITVEDIMGTLLDRREYNMLFYDRSVIQYEFTIEDGKIIKERLIFIKKHNFLWSKEEIDIKDNDEFGVDWFEEIGIPVVIRIDFDEEQHEEMSHPTTHMTLSNYDECRIPMMSSVSLYNFINFILNFFYNDNLECHTNFVENDITITENEKKMVHFEWN